MTGTVSLSSAADDRHESTSHDSSSSSVASRVDYTPQPSPVLNSGASSLHSSSSTVSFSYQVDTANDSKEFPEEESTPQGDSESGYTDTDESASKSEERSLPPLLDEKLIRKDQDEAENNLQHPLTFLANALAAQIFTISDDQSVTEKVEERNLLALRDRSEYLDSSPESIPRPAISSHALQDYQMQLMLLEQQNKKRLLITRRVQTDCINMAPPEIGIEIAPGNPTLMNSSNPINKRHNMEADLPSLSNDDISSMDAVELQSYIERLQARAKQLGATQKNQTSSRYLILYRILEDVLVPTKHGGKFEQKLSAPFFDPPEFVRGQGKAQTLRCKIPLINFDLYLEQNKDVSFIVYRTYVTPDAGTISNRHTNIDSSDMSQQINESIRPVAQDLINALEAILQSREEYADLLQTYRLTSELHAPYIFMYHNRKDLDTIRNSFDQSTQEHLTLFSDYIVQNHGSMYAAADSLISQGKISTKYINYLFKTGDVLVQRQENEYRGWIASSWPRISSTERISRSLAETVKKGEPVPLYGSGNDSKKSEHDMVLVHYWNIQAWHWDFDGNFQRRDDLLKFTTQTEDNRKKHAKKAMAHDYSETQDEASQTDLDGVAIEELRVFPLKHASLEIVNKLRRRGKTFWKCRNRQFVSYQEKEQENVQNAAEERYVIDHLTYRSLHKDNQYENIGWKKGLKDELGSEAMARDDPPDDDFELLLPLTIKGYNLRRKKWYDLMADRVADVKWNKEAFQKVVIDRKAKDLIRALVSNQLAAEVSTDLIAGKGNGLILLLHGSPGTGKTLTAESVAEIAEKPLYRVTCGDVGTQAEAVEKYLESVFHLGKLWNCVVLLDEADVFLEQRSLEDLQRNALVSVFLRVLEYYEGILVLTSNRVGIFDEAFKSRIQLALHYPNLGPYQRLRIWENFIDRLESFHDNSMDIADLRDHLDDLKEEKMNGRQIRNAITTARQYAEWKKTTLTYEHLRDVIDVSGRFDKYLDKLNGGFTQDELAEDDGLRLA